MQSLACKDIANCPFQFFIASSDTRFRMFLALFGAREPILQKYHFTALYSAKHILDNADDPHMGPDAIMSVSGEILVLPTYHQNSAEISSRQPMQFGEKSRSEKGHVHFTSFLSFRHRFARDSADSLLQDRFVPWCRSEACWSAPSLTTLVCSLTTLVRSWIRNPPRRLAASSAGAYTISVRYLDPHAITTSRFLFRHVFMGESRHLSHKSSRIWTTPPS